MPETEVEVVDDTEFDAAFAEKAEQSVNADPEPDIPGEVGTEDAGETDFNNAFADAAGDPAAAKEEPEVDLSTELEKSNAEIERLKQSDRSQRGRVSALTKKLVEQQAANEPPEAEPGTAKGEDTDSNNEDDWEEFQREFPEMASIVDKRLSSVTQQVDVIGNKVEKVSTTQNTLVEDRILTHKAEQFEDLRDSHTDVDQIKVSQEFAMWRVNAPEEIQTKIKSHESSDAADVLDTFKKQTGWKTKAPEPVVRKSEVELINERREANLKKSAGISSKKVGRSTRTDTEDNNDFDSAFDEGARKKEKQRTRMYS
jgi:hypothetical protein